MSETKATIRTRVQRYVGAAIDQTINQAIVDAHKELQRKHNYRFMEDSDSIDVAQGGSTFDLPSDCKAVVNPEMPSSDGGMYARIKGILKNGIMARTVTDTGRPVSFRIWNGAGYLYPTADAALSFPLEYYRWIPAPSEKAYENDDQAQAFIDEVYEFIEKKAIAAGYRRLKNYKAADYWEGEAERKRAELEHDDIDIGLSGVDMQMQLPG